MRTVWERALVVRGRLLVEAQLIGADEPGSAGRRSGRRVRRNAHERPRPALPSASRRRRGATMRTTIRAAGVCAAIVVALGTATAGTAQAAPGGLGPAELDRGWG